jgi:predicted glycosyltransferase involved in capsule biosynthesis
MMENHLWRDSRSATINVSIAAVVIVSGGKILNFFVTGSTGKMYFNNHFFLMHSHQNQIQHQASILVLLPWIW